MNTPVVAHYAPDRRAIVRSAGTAAVALLWHGRGRCQAHVMDRVAQHLPQWGISTVAVDWDSEDESGKSDLLASLALTRAQFTDARVCLVGWSLGATAAISLINTDPAAGVDALVALAPGDGPHVRDPLTSGPLPRTFLPREVPVALVYGTRDRLSTPDRVAGLHMRLRASGWPATLHGVDADHASIVGSQYVARTEQYVAVSRDRTDAMVEIAGIIADMFQPVRHDS